MGRSTQKVSKEQKVSEDIERAESVGKHRKSSNERAVQVQKGEKKVQKGRIVV
jgi:hypothetical protein